METGNITLNIILPKVGAVCYIMRFIKPYISLNTLQIVYYSNFNSLINYGLSFLSNSLYGIKIFRMQNYIIRIMLGCKKEIHSVDTTQHTNLHQPTSNLTKYQKEIYYSGEGVYNNLPPHIKDISDDPKNLELHLKQFLYLHPFYSLEEYFHYKYLLRH
jgi:hypothetical protein